MSSASQLTDQSSDVASAPTVADAIGDALWDLGVERIFTLLGSGNFVAVHAFGQRGGEILHTRHENVSVAMADGWARVAGGVGVASLHTGPGLTNAITAIAEATKSSTPLVVLCGDVAPTSGPTNFRINQHGAVESVGAAAERVLSPRTVRVDVARAYRRAEVERRPVVLMMPMDMQGDVKGLQLAGAPVWIPELFNGLALLIAVGMAKYQGTGRGSAIRRAITRRRPAQP